MARKRRKPKVVPSGPRGAKSIKGLTQLLELMKKPGPERPTVNIEIPEWVKFPKMAKKVNHTEFTDDSANKILAAKRMGASDGMASAYGGIGALTLSRWKERDYEPFLTFQTEYLKAEAYPKFFFLDAVIVNAYTDPGLALKMLGRMEPETFAEVVVVDNRHSGSVNLGLGPMLERVMQKIAERRGQMAKQVGAGSTQTALSPALVNNGKVKPHDPRPPRVS